MPDSQTTGRKDGLHCVYGQCQADFHNGRVCNPGCSFTMSTIDSLKALVRSLKETDDGR